LWKQRGLSCEVDARRLTVTKAQRRAKARALEVAAWSLYCEGHSMPEIAAQHHVTRQAVHKAIKRAIARAMDGLTGNIREQKAAQVARLERIAELAMESFRKSCGEATKKTRRSRMRGTAEALDEAVVTTTEPAGDPRFLEQARGALADIRKILGTDAPAKVSVTEPDRPLKDVPTEDLWAELDALRAQLAPKTLH
jgi:transposase